MITSFVVDSHGCVRIRTTVTSQPRKMTLLERLDAQGTFLADDAAARIRALEAQVDRMSMPWAYEPVDVHA